MEAADFAQEYNELTEAAIYSHPPSKAGPSSDEELDYEDDASWGSKKKPAKRRKSVSPSTPPPLDTPSLISEARALEDSEKPQIIAEHKPLDCYTTPSQTFAHAFEAQIIAHWR